MSKPLSILLHVCVTCKAASEAAEPPGQRLYHALVESLAGIEDDLELRPVSCLAACDHGCTAAVFKPGKPFGYLLGHLQPQHAEAQSVFTLHPAPSSQPGEHAGTSGPQAPATQDLSLPQLVPSALVVHADALTEC